ncbi:MAG TPA: flagellar hook-basal body complex protein, partial [Terriglobia bacterium]|nr:flagellar hook-basal body complex protein [Terriglobia bacterium]
SGGRVLGYPAVQGVPDTNAPVGPITIATGLIIPATPTANVLVAMNLDAEAAVGDTFSTAVEIYYALGSSHLITFQFTKTAANSWDYDITIPAADVGQNGAPVSLSSGTIDFDGAGVLQNPAANVAGISITGLANGANDLSFDWNLFDSAGVPVITQAASPSAASRTQQDGLASGTLLNFHVNGDGVIEGTLSNGQTLALGQIALVTFPNSQGLLSNGNGNFLATFASGAPNLGVAGTGGRGSIAGGALERSNVDIATEFSKLIQAQRGYQANARAITTADELTQAALSLKS